MIKSLKVAACSVFLLTAHNAMASASGERVMNWAESLYPSLFPSEAQTTSASPWAFRYYPETGTYLGINDSDEVYVMGGSFGDTPQQVGSVNDFLTTISDTGVPIETTIPEVSIQNEQANITATFSYSDYSPSGETYKQIKLIPRTDDAVSQISAEMTFGDDSYAAGNAEVSGEARLMYEQPDGNILTAALKVRGRGDRENLSLQAYLSMCLDSACTSDIYYDLISEGDIENYSSQESMNHNLSVEWQESSQAFVFTLNGQSLVMTKADFDASEDAQANGVTLNTDNFYRSELRTRIKKINTEGDTGIINISYDNVMLNNAPYDDFSTGLDVNKWKAYY